MKRLRTVLIIGGIGLFYMFSSLGRHAFAVTTCVNPDVNSAASAWAKGAQIAVTVSGFSTALQPCVKAAFDGWNTAAGTNGTGVNSMSDLARPLTHQG